MKKDLFKELGLAADKAILSEEEMLQVEGGNAFEHLMIDIQNGFRCILDHDNIGYCVGNVCDPSNCGACAGNTVGGGPRTCPQSL